MQKQPADRPENALGNSFASESLKAFCCQASHKFWVKKSFADIVLASTNKRESTIVIGGGIARRYGVA